MNISEFSSLEGPLHPHFYNSPNVPCVKPLGPNHVVVMMACNDTLETVKSIMENKLFHEECRACLCNPKAMQSEPTWIRVEGVRGPPKQLSDAVDAGGQQ